MSDLDPSPEVNETETGGGLGSFLSSAPRVIGSITALIGAVTGLLIALNKTGIIGGDGDDGDRADRNGRSSRYIRAFDDVSMSARARRLAC